MTVTIPRKTKVEKVLWQLVLPTSIKVTNLETGEEIDEPSLPCWINKSLGCSERVVWFEVNSLGHILTWNHDLPKDIFPNHVHIEFNVTDFGLDTTFVSKGKIVFEDRANVAPPILAGGGIDHKPFFDIKVKDGKILGWNPRQAQKQFQEIIDNQ